MRGWSIGLATSLLLIAAEAAACTMPTRHHNPALKPADVIVEAIVGKVDRDGILQTARLRVVHAWLGPKPKAPIELKWSVAGGMCGPPGPIPETGSRFMVYLAADGRNLVPIGWLPLTRVPRVKDILRINEFARARIPGRQ